MTSQIYLPSTLFHYLTKQIKELGWDEYKNDTVCSQIE